MLCLTARLCKTGPDLRRLFHGELYRKSGDNLSIISVSMKAEQFTSFSPPTGCALRRKVLQCHLMSLAELQAECAHLSLGPVSNVVYIQITALLNSLYEQLRLPCYTVQCKRV
jgi:hypothetical protein